MKNKGLLSSSVCALPLVEVVGTLLDVLICVLWERAHTVVGRRCCLAGGHPEHQSAVELTAEWIWAASR